MFWGQSVNARAFILVIELVVADVFPIYVRGF